jgi:hypothetical protein
MDTLAILRWLLTAPASSGVPPFRSRAEVERAQASDRLGPPREYFKSDMGLKCISCTTGSIVTRGFQFLIPAALYALNR